MLTRDDFLNAPPPPPREEVEVPALGGTVFVRRITAGDRDDFESSLRRIKGVDYDKQRALIAVMVTTDADGEPLFGPGDLKFLSDLPVAYLEPILDAHRRINVTLGRDEAAELEKN